MGCGGLQRCFLFVLLGGGLGTSVSGGRFLFRWDPLLSNAFLLIFSFLSTFCGDDEVGGSPARPPSLPSLLALSLEVYVDI
jgi:hypothetical protein